MMNYGQRKTTTTLDLLSESFMGARHAPRPAARKPKVVAGAQTLLSIVNFTWSDS
jgi:hypothetical protein